jgi:hypothetical protein
VAPIPELLRLRPRAESESEFGGRRIIAELIAEAIVERVAIILYSSESLIIREGRAASVSQPRTS